MTSCCFWSNSWTVINIHHNLTANMCILQYYICILIICRYKFMVKDIYINAGILMLFTCRYTFKFLHTFFLQIKKKLMYSIHIHMHTSYVQEYMHAIHIYMHKQTYIVNLYTYAMIYIHKQVCACIDKHT